MKGIVVSSSSFNFTKSADKKYVAQKVVMDVLKGLHPVTGRPCVHRSPQYQSEVLHAAIRSYSEIETNGQIVSLVEDLDMQTKWSEERTEDWVRIMKRAVCDDYEIGLSINDIAEDYGLTAKRVLAILIDECKLSGQEAVFFIRSLQQSSPKCNDNDIGVSNQVISLNRFR